MASVVVVNNEIGTLKLFEEIGTLCWSRNILFYADIAQMMGKFLINMNKMKIDLMSMNGYNVYGSRVGGCFM